MRFFVNECESFSEHQVYIQTCSNHENDELNKKKLQDLGIFRVRVYPNEKALVNQLKQMKTDHKNIHFVFHSMLSRWLWFYLFPTHLPNTSTWVSWGADLYQHIIAQPQKKSWSQKIKQRLAKQIQAMTCQRFHSVKTLNPGDAELLRSTLGRSRVDVLPYPLVGVEAPEVFIDKKEPIFRLLLGNSAAPSNNHYELLDSVSHLKAHNIELVMPLNYAGEALYIEQVIKYGHTLFGDKFVPITDMLSKQKYDELLTSIDGTVFAHDRQQGLYVAYYMMLHGKKLFLKSSTSTYQNFCHYGFHVEDLELLSACDFNELMHNPMGNRSKNQQVLQHTFTEKALAPKWSQFFIETQTSKPAVRHS